MKKNIKRYYYDEFGEDIYDNQNDYYPSNETICETLNKQDQLIAELEEQLKNAIVPKFKVDETVFVISAKTIRKAILDEIYWISSENNFVYFTTIIYGLNDVQNETIEEDKIFTTKEEAQAKLLELYGVIYEN